MKSIVLPAGTEHVQFGELAHCIADALWPDAGTDDDRMTYAAARINLDGELARAVDSGALPVKDPLTFGPHTFPLGDALKRALVTVADLSAFVAGRGLSVLFQFTVDEDGGTTSFNATQAHGNEILAEKKALQRDRQAQGHYTMHEVAEVLAAAYDIGGAKNFLDKRMRPAAESGALVLLDPIDRGPVTGRLCRPYADWVTPTNANKWLDSTEFDFRWPIAAREPTDTPGQSSPTPAPVFPAVAKKWTPELLAELKAYRKKHGTKEAAKHYGVSESRVRELLPGEKPKPKGYSAFTHHIS